MKICTIASSSSGNCTLVTDGRVNILIDAGISMRRIATGLRRAGIAPEDLTAVLVTHEHSDHISGLPMLTKHFDIPVYATFGTAEGMRKACPGAKMDMNEFAAGEAFDIGGLYVQSFSTPHDTPESVGYRITGGNSTFVLATDTGFLSETLLDAAKGANAAVIEANHDTDMLRYGRYPAYLKRRIMSDRGHMSNRVCGIFAQELAKSGTKRIILAHLSKENNTPELAYRTVSAALGDIGASVGEDVMLTVAPRCDMSELFTL